jgi:hypothetical protein
MENKIEAIQLELQKKFHGQTIKYQFAHELHKFRIEDGKQTHWLYIDRDYVEDTDSTTVIKVLSSLGIIEKIKSSNSSKWLYLDSSGVQEVDDNFAK